MSDDLRLVAARRAVMWLKASGLQFAVKMPDGTIEGELLNKPPAQRVRVHDWKTSTDYHNKLKEMKPGDYHVWDMAPDLLEPFRSTVSAAAGKVWGKGTYITEIKDGKVGLLRCE